MQIAWNLMDLLADEAYLYVNLLRNIALWRSESVHICIGIALSDQARPSQISSEQPFEIANEQLFGFGRIFGFWEV